MSDSMATSARTKPTHRPASNNGSAPVQERHRASTTGAAGRQAQDQPRLKIAYLVSRFPKITETFVLYEMLALEQEGIDVDLYPLQRERTRVVHAEAMRFVRRAHYHPLLSWLIVLAHVHYLRSKPRIYWQVLGRLIRANWGSSRMLLGALAFFPKVVYFARHMEAAGVAHLHAHFASHPAVAAYVVHHLTGIPYSFTAHGSDLHRDQHMLLEKVADAAFVVAISEYNKQVITSVCGDQYADKVNVIHCGIDTKLFRPRVGATLNERGGPFRILCIGTLHEVKGQRYLIQACRLLQEHGIDFVCHFVGDGPDLDALTKLTAQARLNGRVQFHGRMTQPDIVRLLKQVDVVAAPSVPTRDGRREGIPVALMEAMGCGLPVVASRLSGIPELVEDEQSGLLVPPRDVLALAFALERLYGDLDLRHRLGVAGRAKVVREFDLRANAGQLLAYFRGEVES